MLLFGHIGVTIGIFFLLGLAFPAIRPYIKYEYVALGSLLPDLIDKPVGRLLLADSIANGRIFAHTLIFILVLLMVSWYLYKSREEMRMLIISGASFCHLIEDEMWRHLATLLWPLYGWTFPSSPSYGGGLLYLVTMLTKSFSLDYSTLFNAELVGMTIIVLLIVSSITKTIKNSIKSRH